MELTLDEGYQFGLGVFETLKIRAGRAEFLDRHLERMNASLETLGIRRRVSRKEVLDFLEERKAGCCALKIMASGENTLFTLRENPYGQEQYEKGFVLEYSRVLRNETSPLVFHKTLNYGDCILEKRKAKAAGADERIFLNSRGELCEGTACNIFFARGERLYTPGRDCGLLPGIIRGILLEETEAVEAVLRPADIEEMEECFVTNSLMGVMPVRRLGEKEFLNGRIRENCMEILRRANNCCG